MISKSVQEATIARISAYSKFLKQLEFKGIDTVLNSEIAEETGVSPARIRKDLSYLGKFGIKGISYNVKDLLFYTLRILRFNMKWPLVLVGAGDVGKALCSFKELNNNGFSIIGVFDNDPNKIGKKIGNLEVYSLEKLAEFIEINKVRIGILAVPVKSAQTVAEIMIKGGLQAILNFALVSLKVPECVEVQNIDTCLKLELLNFKLGIREQLYG